MAVRRLILISVVAALGIVSPVVARAEGKLADNFVDVKLLFPVNGLEYEHVFPNGIGVSIAGSYVSAKVDVDSDESADDDVVSATQKVSAKYSTVGGGIKKYIGTHRMFYVGAYVNALNVKVQHEETVLKGEGSLHATTVLGALGWRGVLGHFTIGGELGGGFLGLKDIHYWGTNDDGETTRETVDVPVSDAGPMAQFYLGYGF